MSRYHGTQNHPQNQECTVLRLREGAGVGGCEKKSITAYKRTKNIKDWLGHIGKHIQSLVQQPIFSAATDYINQLYRNDIQSAVNVYSVL